MSKFGYHSEIIFSYCEANHARQLNRERKINVVLIILTFSLHSHTKAFPHSAVLTAITVPLVYRTASCYSTSVIQTFLDTSFEEQFATLAGIRTIMSAGRVIAADSADLHFWKDVNWTGINLIDKSTSALSAHPNQ